MFVIGTAGHVDHGKSLLVEALTGIDPDRLREEKTRGMTIDLGFAWLTLPSGRSVSIVDVPGHERFIKNMLAGAGGVDLALLVVAADDGVMPQTREHLAILDLLGVSRGVVALTKRDLVDADWLALIEADIAETLRGTTLESAPVIACSSLTREGLDNLLAALDAAVEGLPAKQDIGRPRLPIDRVFTIDGFGTVVTGTLIDGTLSAGDEVEATPGGLRGRIRGLQSHKDKVERAMPGTRTAVNLTGIERGALRRGMVLAPPSRLTPTGVLDARVRAVDALPHALRHNMRITFHTGADEAPGRLRLLDADEMRAGDETWAQIKLDAPVAVVRGDRFVLRTPNDTVAGGTVVDAAPKRHRRRHQPTLDSLAALLSDAPEDLVLDAIRRTPLIERAALAAAVTLPAATFDAAVTAVMETGLVRAFADGPTQRLATASFVDETHAAARAAIGDSHARFPLRAGLPLEELRSRLKLDAAALTALATVWPDLRIGADLAALTSFVPAPTSQQHRLIDAYLDGLSSSPYSPPSLDIDDELLAYLAHSRKVVDTGNGMVFEAQAFDAMKHAIQTFIEAHGTITMAQARDLLGTSRRYVQSVLEHLDRLRVTRRNGDERVLR